MQVTLGDRGHYIHWNETIDFCADVLCQPEYFLAMLNGYVIPDAIALAESRQAR